MNKTSGSLILHLIEVLIISIITFAMGVLRLKSVLLCQLGVHVFGNVTLCLI